MHHGTLTPALVQSQYLFQSLYAGIRCETVLLGVNFEFTFGVRFVVRRTLVFEEDSDVLTRMQGYIYIHIYIYSNNYVYIFVS